MWKILTILGLTLTMSSCSSNLTYYAVVNDATGIVSGDPITIKGIVYGEIKDVKLTKEAKVILELGFDKSYELPIDSKIVLRPTFFEKTLLFLEVGQENNYLSSGDTLFVIIEQTETNDSTISNIGEFLENVFTSKKANSQRDSILKELKRLNKNMEEERR